MADSPPIPDQASYWDQWNVSGREQRLPQSSVRQGDEIERTVAALQRPGLKILDIGCGTGWLSERLAPYGAVTATDMTASTIERARKRLPHIEFLLGDFFELSLPRQAFDVVVCLEVLSHVADQPAFIERIASLMKPGALLMLSTQNRPVLERWSEVAPADPKQIRKWVDQHELRALLARHFAAVSIQSLHPVGDRGMLRWINAEKLNRLAGLLVRRATIDRWKERAMLGHTLLATARR